MQFERQNFYKASMEYVLVLQEVQERKKFEFVETVRLRIWKPLFEFYIDYNP